MFAMLSKVCAAAICSFVFGPVDWKQPYNGETFSIGTVQVIIDVDMNGAAVDDPDSIASGKQIRKIVGRKPVFCTGTWGSHGVYQSAECYFYGRHGEVVDVAKEMHKHGFPGYR